MPHGRKGYSRIDRVKQQILKEMADLIRSKLRDPRIGFVTLTDIELTRDYKNATLYYTLLNEEDIASTQETLTHSKGFLRKELGQRIRLFHTPELSFKYDASVKRGSELVSLLNQINEEKLIEN